MYIFYAHDNDLLDSKHFPVIPLLNEACNLNFLDFIDAVSHDTGRGYNYSSCSFWEDLAEEEKQSIPANGGIVLWTMDDPEVILSLDIFLYYLKLAASRFIEVHPDMEKTITSLLSSFEQKVEAKNMHHA